MRKVLSSVVFTAMLLMATPASAESVDPSPVVAEAGVLRFKGEDRYQTAVAISEATFPVGVPVVFVVTGEKYPDALAASALAGAMGGAVLLTRSSSLPEETRGELLRLAPPLVVVLGGTVAVAETVVEEIRQALPNAVVRRDAGATRYETAVEASRQAISTTNGTVYVGSGLGFTEVIAASVAAARDRGPLLLVPGTGSSAQLPFAVAAELVRLEPSRIRIVGGTGLVAASVEEDIKKLLPRATVDRIAGSDGYETAAAIAAEGVAGRSVWVATGDVFADGLGGAAAAVKQGASLVMVPRSGSLTPAIQNTLLTLSPSSFVVLGGEMAVTPVIADQVKVHQQGYFSLFVDPQHSSDANVQRLVHMSLRTMARYRMSPGVKLFFYSKDPVGVAWVQEALDREQCLTYLSAEIIASVEGTADACGFIMRMGVGVWDLPFPVRTRLVTAAHEMFHSFQFQRLQDCVCPTSEPGAKLQRWFLEGSADVAGFTMVYGEGPQTVRDLIAVGASIVRTPGGDIGFDEMNYYLGNPLAPRPSSIPLYERSSMAVWYLILQTSFDTVMIDFYDRIASVGNFDDAFVQTFGMTVPEYEKVFVSWINSL
jgi:putative cell wall-binding protein